MKQLQSRGGGKLVVPPSVYDAGFIQMFRRTTLEVQNGAVLRFFQREDAYPLIDYELEGVPGLMHRPCIHAEHAQFVTNTGEGAIDGQGDNLWEK